MNSTKFELNDLESSENDPQEILIQLKFSKVVCFFSNLSRVVKTAALKSEIFGWKNGIAKVLDFKKCISWSETPGHRLNQGRSTQMHCFRLVNETRATALVQAATEANQCASAIDRVDNITNCTETRAGESFFLFLCH